MGGAEDWGKVVGLNENVSVPYGVFSGCLKIEDWNGLEGRSESLENKFQCPGIGTVPEAPADDPGQAVELVDMTSS